MSEPKVINSNPFIFTVTSMGIMGGLIGLIFGVANGSGPIGMIFGAFFMVLISFLVIFLNKNESLVRYSICAFLTLIGFYFIGIIGLFLGLMLGVFSSWFLFWGRVIILSCDFCKDGFCIGPKMYWHGNNRIFHDF